ncbi:hypothetical protein LEP1GSC187_0082 [Leptospira santarosai str. ZUN179]|uniref:Uncharacterized protein n=1 Tax=Leptospira santarosai str. ZUN179 TaxID=1049985 RepID=M6UHP8_9LEPT|nr:hypothetical protein LEP1GSC187_0082 [Leptospira santarosai str. ZUN179]
MFLRKNECAKENRRTHVKDDRVGPQKENFVRIKPVKFNKEPIDISLWSDFVVI